jgi:formylglycine-generating enzyme required for sulfatase activity
LTFLKEYLKIIKMEVQMMKKMFFSLVCLSFWYVLPIAPVQAQSPVLPAYAMKQIAAGIVTADTNSGVFSRARAQNVQVAAFKIGETEVTYELWYAVRQWAESKGYSFFNKGREGSMGKDGAAPTENKTHPVTYINWRDAMVWCNAYSEASGKVPVYYEDSGFTRILKTSQGQEASVGEGIAEKGAVKSDANGFRLPTEIEWEFAARGGVPGEGAWSYRYAGTNTEDQLGNFAWYIKNSDQSTHPVGTRTVSGNGLKDINGNVWEWCYNIYENNRRSYRGGGWNIGASDSTVSYRNSSAPYLRSNDLGLRVVCQ